MLNEFIPEFLELRKKFLIALLLGVIGVFFGLFFASPIISFLIQTFNLSAVSLKPTDAFNVYLKTSFYFGFILFFISFLIQFYFFAKQALHENEIKLFKKILFLSFGLFLFGTITGLIVTLISLNFFSEFAVGMGLQNYWGIESIINYMTNLMILFGLVFVFVPLIIFFVVRYLKAKKRNVLLYSFVLSPVIAVLIGQITPPDFFSQIALWIPIYLLIFLSLALIKKEEF